MIRLVETKKIINTVKRLTYELSSVILFTKDTIYEKTILKHCQKKQSKTSSIFFVEPQHSKKFLRPLLFEKKIAQRQLI